MFFNKYFRTSFSLSIVVALLHYAALEKFFYWTLAWYDILMHFLGGLWAGLFFLWLVHLDPKKRYEKFARPRYVFAFLFAIGLLWEAYELFFDLVFVSDQGYFFDTSLDLVMDALGASLAAFLIRKKGASSVPLGTASIQN